MLLYKNREEELEARLLNVMREHEKLRQAKRALETKIVDMALEQSNVLKELGNRRIKIAQYDKLAGELADVKKENEILRSLLGTNAK